MQISDNWRPCASIDALKARAEMFAKARKYFRDSDALEVETPLIVPAAVTDVHITSVTTSLNDNKLWLRTSPEYHMKRLLAQHSMDIFQIGKVFRDGESGRNHEPEFTMLEWYRIDFGLNEMIADTCKLIACLHQSASTAPDRINILNYADAFLTTCGLNPNTASVAKIKSTCEGLLGDRLSQQSMNELGDDRNSWLDLLASHIVIPELAKDRLLVIKNYPADQAMLARINPDDPSLAERFEVFLNGVELANGFCELTDADEQARRFADDNNRRVMLNKKTVPEDALLLAALDHGLPACSGVAVGLDRILMQKLGCKSISDTLSFKSGC